MTTRLFIPRSLNLAYGKTARLVYEPRADLTPFCLCLDLSFHLCKDMHKGMGNAQSHVEKSATDFSLRSLSHAVAFKFYHAVLGLDTG
jgi:hypothetical protein